MDKREELLQIATRLFSERGFENMVCEAANVSKGLISHHFKSKNGMLREIFSKTTEMIIEMNELDSSKRTAQERLLQLLESFFTQIETDKMLFQFNLNMIVQPKTKEVLSDLIKERSDFILKSTQSIFKEIDPENYVVMSYLFIAELDGIAISYLGIFDDYPLKEIKEHFIKKYAQWWNCHRHLKLKDNNSRQNVLPQLLRATQKKEFIKQSISTNNKWYENIHQQI